MARKAKRINTYFRQTAKSFKAARQTKIFSHINRSLPHSLYKFSRERMRKSKQKLNKKFSKLRNIPKRPIKIKLNKKRTRKQK